MLTVFPSSQVQTTHSSFGGPPPGRPVKIEIQVRSPPWKQWYFRRVHKGLDPNLCKRLMPHSGERRAGGRREAGGFERAARSAPVLSARSTCGSPPRGPSQTPSPPPCAFFDRIRSSKLYQLWQRKATDPIWLIMLDHPEILVKDKAIWRRLPYSNDSSAFLHICIRWKLILIM